MDSFESQLLDLTSEDEESLAASPTKPTNPYAPLRSAEEQAELDARKEEGDAPTGRKTSGKNVTDADARQILEPLALLRAMTAEQLSILGRPKEVNWREGAANFHNPRSIQNRLNLLRRAGIVESSDNDLGRTLWGLTPKGIEAALYFGRIASPDQVNYQGVHGMKLTTLQHTEAVNWVAAQALSRGEYAWKGSQRLPSKVLSLSQLRTEHQITKDWTAVNKALEAQRRENPNGPQRKFVDWRSTALRDARADATMGRVAWKHMMRYHPGLWTIARRPAFLNEKVNEHHLPDLVIDLEDHRKSEKRVSIGIEVELTPKRLDAYQTQFAMWRHELSYVSPVDGAMIYSKLLYFTNNKKVVEFVKLAADDLIENKFLEIHPLTGRDGVTPLNLSNRT